MLEEVHHRGKLREYIILPYFRILSLYFMAALGDDSFLHVPSYKTVSSNPNTRFAPGEHSLESSSNALLLRWNQYISLSLFSFPFFLFFNLLALLVDFLLTTRSHCITSLLPNYHICFCSVCLEPAEESSL